MKAKFVKIKKFLRKIINTLAGNPFLAFLSAIFLALIFGVIVFYKYDILNNKTEIETPEASLKLQEKSYQGILESWRQRESKFNEANSKIYSNPLAGSGKLTE